ncbi:MAG: CDC48 family AAA ATPase [Halobacteria archaeon]
MPPPEVRFKVAKATPRQDGQKAAEFSSDALLQLQVSPGEMVSITGPVGTTVAKVWRMDRADQVPTGVPFIRIDGPTRDSIGARIGDEVLVVRAQERKDARRIVVAPAREGARLSASLAPQVRKRLLTLPLVAGDLFYFERGPFGFEEAQRYLMRVVETEPPGVVLVSEETQMVLEAAEEEAGAEESGPAPTGPGAVGEAAPAPASGIHYEDIGGLRRELSLVREMIEKPLRHPQLFERLGIEPPKGVLLHGPPGTGKTLIARAVASESGARFFSIAGPEIISRYYGEPEKRLREIFEKARKSAPAVIFLDEMDAIAPKRSEVTGEVERRVVDQLLSLMDGLQGRGQVIVIAATNRPNAIDEALRRPGRFDREIELGVPGREDRLDIMKIHTRRMPLADEEGRTLALDDPARERLLADLAAQTPGFVGADLAALCREAAMKALRRHLPKLEGETIPPEAIEQMQVRPEDFREALREMEPSALREVLFEIPEVSWEEVGGLGPVKQEVREMVEWPIHHPERFERMGIRAPRGILLYGPPGTGKTLMAKAAAQQAGVNFISIRGPELMSKWVGESERAVREIFRKARQAAPCVVFFDEMDAIAPVRGWDVSNVGTTERVVNQLLSEMDGLQKAGSVVVLAATNRPEILDPALIRPGRFDRLLMVGPPDREGRLEILKIHTRKMPLDPDVDPGQLVEATEGYVGSDLESLCREAAMVALRRDGDVTGVSRADFQEALRRVKPSVTRSMMERYEKVREALEGGLSAARARAVEGYR